MLPLACAQMSNYNSYSSLTIESDITSSIGTVITGNGAKLNTFAANLSFFPREGIYQEIVSQRLISSPEATITETENYVLYEWTTPTESTLTYGLKTTMETNNDLTLIESKVNFPFNSLTEDLLTYTQYTEKIDINDGITAQAQELAQGETDLFHLTFEVANWVKENIEYNLSTLTQEAVQPSSWVLENEQGVCDELTNLYISMMRSLGVPARFVAGQAYTNLGNAFGNHGWAEVYFPGYGWIPFDVTYGQLGWVDPTHIIYKRSIDSGEPSVEYLWRAQNMDVEIGPLDIMSRVIEFNGEATEYIELSVEPLSDSAGPGSYVPVKVTVKNLYNFYVPITLMFSKAPEIYGTNQKAVLLEPNEEKDVYWIIKIPSDIDQLFVYTSTLEVKSGQDQVAESSIIYGTSHEIYAQEFAESIVEQYMLQESVPLLDNVDINCEFDQESYYDTESATLTCDLISSELQDLEVCLIENCQTLSSFSGTTSLEWSIPLTDYSTKIMLVYATDGESYRYSYPVLNVVKQANIFVTDYEPKTLTFGEKTDVVFTVKTDNYAENFVLTIKGQGGATMASLQDEINITLPVKGSYVFAGNIPIELSYQDTAGKKYEVEQPLEITVENVPWILEFYLKVVSWFSR